MNRPFAEFLIKLAGIFSLLKVLSYLQPLIDTFSQKNLNLIQDKVISHKLFLYSISSISVAMITFLSVGIVLIKYAPIITNRLIEKDEPAKQISEHSIQVICFSLIGVYLFTAAINQIVYPLAEYHFLKETGDFMPAHGVKISAWASLVANSVQAIVGLGLFFGARGLSSIWRFFQKPRPMRAIDKNT